VLNISGGLFEVRGTATRLAVGWKASGATGGGTGIVNIGAMDNGGGGGGGTLAVGYIERSDDPTAVALINFHGGTLKARYDTDDFLKLTTNCVYAEDAVIDTDGHDVTVLTALEAPAGKGVTSVSLANTGSGYTAPPVVKLTGGTGFGATAIATVSGGAIDSIIVTNPGSGYAASDTITVEILGSDGTGADGVGATVALADNVSGGLTKKGPGTLRLNADNTYTGATLVEAGTLLVDGSITSDVAVMADALLGGTGTVTGDVVVATGGSVAPGASVGSLAVTGDLAIDGTLDVEFNSDTDAIDLLAVSGGMDLSGATISFADLGTSSLSLPAYVFATYGSITGDPATLDGTPAGYVVDYAYAGKQIALVAIPEPTTLAMLLGVMIGLLAIRRK
jgi:autotransporter-associated beta strand protein